MYVKVAPVMSSIPFLNNFTWNKEVVTNAKGNFSMLIDKMTKAIVLLREDKGHYKIIIKVINQNIRR